MEEILNKSISPNYTYILSKTHQPTFHRSRYPEPTSPQPCCAPGNKKQVDELVRLGFIQKRKCLIVVNLKEGNMLMVISATELVIESSSRVCHRKDLNFSVVCIEGEGGRLNMAADKRLSSTDLHKITKRNPKYL